MKFDRKEEKESEKDDQKKTVSDEAKKLTFTSLPKESNSLLARLVKR
jgi:hypothetical protein